MENTISKNLIVSIIIDNSILVPELKVDQKINEMINELASLSDPNLKISMHVFDGLKSKIIKDFESKEVESIEFNGFPLMNTILKEVLQQTSDYLSTKTEKEDFPIHRPWMIILSSGLGYDKVDFFETFELSKKEWQPALFPFLLSNKYTTYDLAKINQIKPFMLIKDNQLNAFTKWIKAMITERLKIPANQGIKLDKRMFEGWVEL